jgi:hypothetical protein
MSVVEDVPSGIRVADVNSIAPPVINVGAPHALARDRAAQMTGERARLAGNSRGRQTLAYHCAAAANAFFDQPSEQIDNEQPPPLAWKISIPNWNAHIQLPSNRPN